MHSCARTSIAKARQGKGQQRTAKARPDTEVQRFASQSEGIAKIGLA
nr:MAG TPA: hypothetical protein [Caudoviricetes sp.]